MKITPYSYQGWLGARPGVTNSPPPSPPSTQTSKTDQVTLHPAGVRRVSEPPSSVSAPQPPPPPPPLQGESGALAGPNGTLFQEDSFPRTHFQSFSNPAHLETLPADFQAGWRSRVPIPPADFFGRLVDSPKVGIGSGDLSLEEKNGQVEWLEYNLKLSDPVDGRPIGAMCRDIFFDEPEGPRVSHAFFSLTHDVQGRGIAKELLARSVELYDEIGVKTVSLHAGLDVGGYAWAKYGFKPEEGEATEKLFEKLRARLDRLDVPSGTRAAVHRLLAEDRPEAISAVADLDGVTVEDVDGPTTLGKALLLGTSWSGKLDLRDPVARQRFDHYINKGGANGPSKGA